MDPGTRARFETLMLPHLDAAYATARALLRHDADAEDAVQDAYLRAFRYFEGFRGGDGRAWLLAIVRNSCHTLRHRRRHEVLHTEFDEALHGDTLTTEGPEATDAGAPRGLTRAMLERALDDLPDDAREILVLRELQGLTYQEISHVIGVPMGTVMSRLSRARHRLRLALGPALREMLS